MYYARVDGGDESLAFDRPCRAPAIAMVTFRNNDEDDLTEFCFRYRFLIITTRVYLLYYSIN